MTVRVVPTLATMAEVYRLRTDGGVSSARFHAYVAAARRGDPIAHYNPMTSKPAGETVEALLAADTEALAAKAAACLLAELDVDVDLVLHVTVATPGMWTDRVVTEVEHRLGGTRSSEVLFWTGEPADAAGVVRRARGQALRAAWAAVHGPVAPRDTVRAAVAREGLALIAGGDGPPPLHADAAADAVELLGDQEALSDRVAVTFGDGAAVAMGYTPLGLSDLAGARHGASRCADTDFVSAFRSGPLAPWL